MSVNHLGDAIPTQIEWGLSHALLGEKNADEFACQALQNFIIAAPDAWATIKVNTVVAPIEHI